MKKIGLIVLILTAVLILALAFLENRIDRPWGDSSKESRSSTSGTSMTTDTSGTTDVSDTTDTTDASDTTEATDTTAPPPILCTHDWKWESSTAICSKDGESLYRCSLCHETKTEYDPAYGCYDDDTNGLCDGCGIVTGECLHRVVTEKGYAATCTLEGLSDRRYCEKCGIVLEEHTSLPALGHESEILEAVPSNCISAGLTEGACCSRCGLILVAQTALPLGDHSGNEGVCTVCGIITDAKLALGYYIVKNGTKQAESERYIISKTAEKFGYTGVVSITFDPESSSLIFSADSTTLGIDGIMTMILNFESNVQKVELNGVYDGRPGYAKGNINTDTFSPKNQYVRNFEYEFENTSQSTTVLRTYMGVAVSEMLILCGEMIGATNTGVTMVMLGFPNY